MFAIAKKSMNRPFSLSDWLTDIHTTKYQILKSIFQQIACLNSINSVLNAMRIDSFAFADLHVLVFKNWNVVHLKNYDAKICKCTLANELIPIVFNAKFMKYKPTICWNIDIKIWYLVGLSVCRQSDNEKGLIGYHWV